MKISITALSRCSAHYLELTDFRVGLYILCPNKMALAMDAPCDLPRSLPRVSDKKYECKFLMLNISKAARFSRAKCCNVAWSYQNS